MPSVPQVAVGYPWGTFNKDLKKSVLWLLGSTVQILSEEWKPFSSLFWEDCLLEALGPFSQCLPSHLLLSSHTQVASERAALTIASTSPG